jgi:hypothetical protein
LTVVLSGEVPTQPQALIAVQNSSRYCFISNGDRARDKYRLNVLGRAIDEFTSIQNGLGC